MDRKAVSRMVSGSDLNPLLEQRGINPVEQVFDGRQLLSDSFGDLCVVPDVDSFHNSAFADLDDEIPVAGKIAMAYRIEIHPIVHESVRLPLRPVRVEI